jgi:hypothetical protein
MLLFQDVFDMFWKYLIAREKEQALINENCSLPSNQEAAGK